MQPKKQKRNENRFYQNRLDGSSGMAPEKAHGDEGHRPERQCALTRARLPSDALLRFCLDPDGKIVPDLKNRLPGRGVWLTCSRDVVDKATKKGVFSRALATRATVDPTLGQDVDALLEKAALNRLSLAKKAGQATSGFAKVEEALSRGKAILLVHAADAAPAGRKKLENKAFSCTHEAIDCFNSAQLSLALGRSNVVHAALSNGGACASFLASVARLQQYRNPEPAVQAA
jgi:predicted RNA-binding protein YlxR (DUF448 family)